MHHVISCDDETQVMDATFDVVCVCYGDGRESLAMTVAALLDEAEYRSTHPITQDQDVLESWGSESNADQPTVAVPAKPKTHDLVHFVWVMLFAAACVWVGFQLLRGCL